MYEFGMANYIKEYRRNNKEYRLSGDERVKAYQKTPKGKAACKASSINTMAKIRGALGRISSNDILMLKKECSCPDCCKTSVLQVDHKRAICLGGNNTPDNIQYLCIEHHKEKSKWERTLKGSKDDINSVPDWIIEMEFGEEEVPQSNQLSIF